VNIVRMMGVPEGICSAIVAMTVSLVGVFAETLMAHGTGMMPNSETVPEQWVWLAEILSVEMGNIAPESFGISAFAVK